MTGPVTVHTVEHGDPTPIPEQGWLWRRLYVYGCTAALAAHVYFTAIRLDDPKALREIVRNDQGLILLFALLYLAGASTEAIAQLVATVRTSRKETLTQAAAAPAPPVGPAVPDKPGWSPP